MKNDTAMSEKLEILQCLIENRMFASSSSALAQELGYKGKMTFYRIMKGEISEKTVEEVWERLKTVYYLEDDDLYAITRICYAAKEFYEAVLPEMNIRHPEWVENVIMSLVEDTYDYHSEAFKKEVVPVLKEWKQEEPNLFWGMAVLFYIRAKKIEPYQKEACTIRRRLLHELDEILYALYPENLQAHQAAQNVMETPHSSFSVWRLLFDAILLFRYYTETDFIRKVAKSAVLFDWPARSYWIAPGANYQEGETVWLLVENDFQTDAYGLYVVLRLTVGKTIDAFHVDEVCLFQFLTADNESDGSILSVARMSNGQKDSCYYVYRYEEEKRMLYFSVVPEYGNKYGLPEVLQRVDLQSPDGKDEKVWSRIMRKFDQEGNGRKIYQKALEDWLGIVDLSAKYSIKNVILDRTFFSLVLESAGATHTYRLSVSRYAFLSGIHPSSRIMITKHREDEAIYVEWPLLGYAVRLAEFTQVD